MSRQVRAGLTLVTLLLVVLAACSGGGASPTPTASPTPEPTATPEPSEAEASAIPTPTTGEAGLRAPAEVEAGSDFEVAWGGPAGQGDYITIVPVGATEWTNTDDYFDVSVGSPGQLKAPTSPGEYELWYVVNADESILYRASITVTPFTGSLLAPEEVAAGTEFEVAWNGSGASGDYVTIVEQGATEWTNTDDYFDVSVGSPGLLYAPMKGGPHEIWYVAADDTIQARIPITVLPLEITLEAPEEVRAGAEFEVAWAGPDGHGDYITIVPAGADEGDYLSYAYTYTGTPVTITAPDTAGEYEIWYATERVRGIFSRLPITVTP